MPILFALNLGIRVLSIVGGQGGDAGGFILPTPVFGIPSVWVALATYVRRWHDLDQSGWLTLTLLIPPANILIFFYLGSAHGTCGPNKYGPDPRA
jgi:uncharacterized membrane protein YhaH (DUF805 family)